MAVGHVAVDGRGPSALMAIHPRLDALLDPATHDIVPDFHWLHEAYLWISGIQWGLGLAHVWFLLAAWRRPRPSPAAGETREPVADRLSV